MTIPNFEWIPVKDKLPPDWDDCSWNKRSINVLVAIDDPWNTIIIGFYQHPEDLYPGTWYYAGRDRYEVNSGPVTHWCLLPKSPLI